MILSYKGANKKTNVMKQHTLFLLFLYPIPTAFSYETLIATNDSKNTIMIQKILELWQEFVIAVKAQIKQICWWFHKQ